MEDRFIVPQFIDAEDKIWGPVTVRQFLIVIVGGLTEFVAYKLADFTLFLLETVFIVVLVIMFAFYKVNGRPFHIFFMNFVDSFRTPRLRIWQKQELKAKDVKKLEDEVAKPIAKKPFIASKKLSELSLIIDTGGAYKGEQDANMMNSLIQEENKNKKDIF